MRSPWALAATSVLHFRGFEGSRVRGPARRHPKDGASLKIAAERIRGVLRGYDATGRYGGEEFLLLLPDCTLDVARDIAERARAAIANTPMETGPVQLLMTVSLGVAWTGSAGTDPTALVAAADAALYRAKAGGRNRVDA
jgi:diguanylate cyclase (GGDEF)-like protein